MTRLLASFMLAGSALAAAPALAAPILLATGTLNGSAAGNGVDLSGLTGALENGLPGNILGGLGSGIAFAGGSTFVATPDRGPNATSYNAAVDDTTSFIGRFQTLTLNLSASAPGAPTPFKLVPTLIGTTLLSSPTPLTYGTGAGLGTKIDGTTPIGSGAPAQNTPGKNFFTGRSDNFGPGNSGNPNNARFDPEGIRVSADGRSVFVSDEYGPYVNQFDRATGSRIKSFALPSNLNVANLSPNGATEISGNTNGRVANKGMEGLAITPDGKTLVGIMQAPLIQDAAIKATKKLVRIVTIDIATGQTREYGVLLTTGSGVSEITAINDHQFLIDERDGAGLGDGTSAVNKTLYEIDIAGAVDITNLTGAAAAAAAVPKTLSVDLVALLNANGITSDKIPAKIEGIAFGQDVTLDGVLEHTLYVSNDNDFVPDVAGPNTIYVIGVTDADLGGAHFVPQEVPEPPAAASFVAGILALTSLLWWRRRT